MKLRWEQFFGMHGFRSISKFAYPGLLDLRNFDKYNVNNLDLWTMCAMHEHNQKCGTWMPLEFGEHLPNHSLNFSTDETHMFIATLFNGQGINFQATDRKYSFSEQCNLVVLSPFHENVAISILNLSTTGSMGVELIRRSHFIQKCWKVLAKISMHLFTNKKHWQNDPVMLQYFYTFPIQH